VLAERADPGLFARAVRELYDRDLEALGTAARMRVLARFTWQQAMQVQQSAYASLAGRSRVRAPETVTAAAEQAP
jgi:hypothetical protein